MVGIQLVLTGVLEEGREEPLRDLGTDHSLLNRSQNVLTVKGNKHKQDYVKKKNASSSKHLIHK